MLYSGKFLIICLEVKIKRPPAGSWWSFDLTFDDLEQEYIMVKEPAECIIRIRDGERIVGQLVEELDPIAPATLHEFVLPANSNVELHYHDVDEYWLFTSGTPKVTLRTPDGNRQEFHLKPGDMVACLRGVEHTLWADHELVYFQFSSVPPEGARAGHLVRD